MGVGCFDWSPWMVREARSLHEWVRPMWLDHRIGALSPQIAPQRGIFVSWGRGSIEYTGHVARGRVP